MEEWFVIVNPVSGRGRGGRDWPRIVEMLDQAGISYTFNFSPARYEAIDLAESVVRMGYRKIIAVGGDGTMHEVLNGLWRQKDVPLEQLTVGVIPVGTGNDWVRHVGIPHDYKKAIDIITKGRVYQQDIIRARYRTPQGESERVVANIAGIGLDAEVIKAVEAEEKTNSGFILTTAAQEKPQIAEVVAVGPGGLVDGKEVTMTVKVGDKVIVSKYSGTEVKCDGVEYNIVKQSDILAIVE